ncbi:hypothetical protein PAXRUDRAFT_20526 [Paxillus rubicundulus Ve08.2h10]|uniref:Uncharacterized protein n=1 Tax=Paxillus rubicundulus Ve08.2h10 TaxID=930991 RepID=A0A0D0D9A9_9AGAM|nr:hypothetical protein PAXRUDRAFT_20526 [Paxillus rubicundulus Ve08.2h10]
MSMGDVIRLKKGSATWWNGPDAKHKYSETNADSNPSKPVTRKITYEKPYHTGGASCFSAPPMRADDGDENGAGSSPDYDLFYRSETHAQWLPVPKGFIVDDKGSGDLFLA